MNSFFLFLLVKASALKRHWVVSVKGGARVVEPNGNSFFYVLFHL